MAIAEYTSRRSFRLDCSDGIVRIVPPAKGKIDAGVMGWIAGKEQTDLFRVGALLLQDADALLYAHVFAIHDFESLLPTDDAIAAKRVGERIGGAYALCRDVPRVLPEVNSRLSDGSVWHVPSGPHLVSIFANHHRKHLKVHLAVAGHGAIEVLHPWAPLLWKPLPDAPGLLESFRGKNPVTFEDKSARYISPVARRLTPIPLIEAK